MKSLLPYLLLLGALAYFIPRSCAENRQWAKWEQDSTRQFRQVDSVRHINDSMAVVNDSLLRVVGKRTVVAERNASIARGAKAEADSFRALLGSSQNAPDSLQNALWLAERLGVAYDSLNSAYGLLEASFRDQLRVTASLTISERQAWGAVDSLSALIRRVPGCRKLPVLGIPVPKVGLGVGVGSHGPGVMVGIVVPWGRC